MTENFVSLFRVLPTEESLSDFIDSNGRKNIVFKKDDTFFAQTFNDEGEPVGSPQWLGKTENQAVFEIGKLIEGLVKCPHCGLLVEESIEACPACGE